jgi:hypothetical protein
MNRIKQYRGSERQQDFVLRINSPRIDRPTLSRIELSIVNPVPEDLRLIASKLGKTLDELYDASDLDYGIHAGSALQACAQARERRKPDLRSKVTVKKCYRIPKATAEWFTIDVLRACGYMSGQSWFDACIRRLRGEYGAIRKATSNAKPGQTSPR